jgi:hypothetical protein
LGVECSDGGGVFPGLQQHSGGAEFCCGSRGQASLAGGVTENVGGFGDFFGKHECVAQSHLAARVAAYIGAVESRLGVAGGFDSFSGFV